MRMRGQEMFCVDELFIATQCGNISMSNFKRRMNEVIAGRMKKLLGKVKNETENEKEYPSSLYRVSLFHYLRTTNQNYTFLSICSLPFRLGVPQDFDNQ